MIVTTPPGILQANDSPGRYPTAPMARRYRSADRLTTSWPSFAITMSQNAPYIRSYSNGSTALTIRSMLNGGGYSTRRVIPSIAPWHQLHRHGRLTALGGLQSGRKRRRESEPRIEIRVAQ